MAHKYSASRFSTRKSCLQKYKLNYIKDIKVEGRDFDVQQKGLAFHKIAEETSVNETLEEITSRGIQTLNEFVYDKEKYPLERSLPLFYKWWQKYVVDLVNNQHYELFKEHWENSSIKNEELCGAIDVLCFKGPVIQTDELNENLIDLGNGLAQVKYEFIQNHNEEYHDFMKDKTIVSKAQIRVYDYKTGSSVHLDGYENQLLIYGYMIGKQLGYSAKDIIDNFKFYLFYPLVGIKTRMPTDDKIEARMLKNVIEYKFSEDEYNSALAGFEAAIVEDSTKDWDGMDPIQNATMSFGCGYCQYCGHPDLCPLSFKSGLEFPETAKVIYP
ncbi:MAG: PD-(D/E)XK nuclease family protein [Clostridia bacterium]|nr:PD-(D/E)XK nuclease family protein [Clostridia bacterium]